jgi:hypothetical protein
MLQVQKLRAFLHASLALLHEYLLERKMFRTEVAEKNNACVLFLFFFLDVLLSVTVCGIIKQKWANVTVTLCLPFRTVHSAIWNCPPNICGDYRSFLTIYFLSYSKQNGRTFKTLFTEILLEITSPITHSEDDKRANASELEDCLCFVTACCVAGQRVTATRTQMFAPVELRAVRRNWIH